MNSDNSLHSLTQKKSQISQTCRFALKDIEALLNELDQNIFTVSQYRCPIAQHTISSIERLTRTIAECEGIGVEQVMREIRWGWRWQAYPPECVPVWGTPSEFPNVVDDETESSGSTLDWLNPEYLRIDYSAPVLRERLEETMTDDAQLLSELRHLSDAELNHAAFRVVIESTDKHDRYYQDARDIVEDAIEHRQE